MWWLALRSSLRDLARARHPSKLSPNCSLTALPVRVFGLISMVHSPAAGIRFSPAVEPHSPARASGDQAEHLQVAHEQIPLQFSLMLLPMSPRRFELIIIMRRLAVFTIARQPRHTAPQNTFDIDHSYTRKECGHERRRED